MMNIGALRPSRARRPDARRPAGFHRSPTSAALHAPALDPGHLAQESAGARPRGPANAGSHKLSGAWNFVLASLYNAGMLPLPAPAHHCPVAARARTLVRGSVAATAAATGITTAVTRGLALAVLFSSMALSFAAHAQAPTQPAATSPADTKRGAQAKPASTGKAKPAGTSSGGKKVISLDDEFLVEGKLEKPSAFYVLRRSSTDYDWARLDAVFTPLVLESVQDPLF